MEPTYPVSSVSASPGPDAVADGRPVLPRGAALRVRVARSSAPRDRAAVTLHGRVYDGQGDPVPDALVEVWQADESGAFATEPGILSAPAADGFRGFGRCPTDPEGRYAFTTVRPGAVPTLDGTPQAPHVAMSVFARGMLRRVVTRVYFESADDPLLSSLPDDRAATLVAVAEDGGYRFDVHLQGPDETVFLDVFAR